MSFNPTGPHKLDLLPPKQAIKNGDFHDLLLNARVELAELKGATGHIPNPLLLITPLMVRESVESSGIENINTTVAKVFENQLLPESEQSTPDKEVIHYREALHWGANKLDEFALSNRIIIGVQQKLLPNDLGGYRKIQNQIVNTRSKEVLYTPPTCVSIPELISNWEKFVNTNDGLDPLLRAAIAHYQFESIHPFLDGNGRTGRILMVLQLVKDGVLDHPILFISGYINKNKSDYYRLLRDVTVNNNWAAYIEFMLQAFCVQAQETKAALKKVESLIRELKQKIKNEHPKIYSGDLLEALFTYPVINPSKMASVLDIHYTTASRYLIELEKAGILHSVKVGRNHFFVN